MATYAKTNQRNERKSSRMDLRLDDARKKLYEKAAEIKGQTLSQWSLASLDLAAEKIIEDSRALYLEEENFKLFYTLLEQPAPPEFQELLAMEPEWA